VSRRRFIADEVMADRAALLGAHAAHLVRVLRVRAGQEYEIVAEGHVRRGRIAVVQPERVEFELGAEIAEESAAPVTLWLAVFKFDRMEWAIEKCTELGVTRIVPLIAARTDAHLAAAAEKRVLRWRRIAVQASEQSRRAGPPDIAMPVKFRSSAPLTSTAENFSATREKATASVRIVLAESEHRRSLMEAMTPSSEARTIELAVGPEGGWTDTELEWFIRSGWIPASLGPTILRAETAAIAAVAIVSSAYGW